MPDPTKIAFIELGRTPARSKDYTLYSDGRVHYFEDGRNRYIPDTNEWMNASSLDASIKQKLLEAAPEELKESAANLLGLV